MSNQDLPTADLKTFIGEIEDMDLSELKNKTFMVAVSTGTRDKGKFICETLTGPLDFLDMVEMVGSIFEKENLHAKAMITSKKFGERPKILDSATIDFIEARYLDILTDSMLDGSLFEDFTCKAGFIPDEPEV